MGDSSDSSYNWVCAMDISLLILPTPLSLAPRSLFLCFPFYFSATTSLPLQTELPLQRRQLLPLQTCSIWQPVKKHQSLVFHPLAQKFVSLRKVHVADRAEPSSSLWLIEGSHFMPGRSVIESSMQMGILDDWRGWPKNTSPLFFAFMSLPCGLPWFQQTYCHIYSYSQGWHGTSAGWGLCPYRVVYLWDRTKHQVRSIVGTGTKYMVTSSDR